MPKLSQIIFNAIESNSPPEHPHTIGKFELVRWANIAAEMEREKDHLLGEMLQSCGAPIAVDTTRGDRGD